jgi:hypothetical protein
LLFKYLKKETNMAIQTREELIEALALVGITGLARSGDLDKLFTGGGGSGTVSSEDITDATVVGKQLIVAATQVAARTAIGAGTSSLTIGTTASTAKAGNYVPTTAEVGSALKAKTQVNALAAVSVADATDGATAATLANANKAAINAIIAALKA